MSSHAFTSYKTLGKLPSPKMHFVIYRLEVIREFISKVCGKEEMTDYMKVLIQSLSYSKK